MSEYFERISAFLFFLFFYETSKLAQATSDSKFRVP